ncbi:MAG: neutral/alkaline non-lysosomal ceramidase N-terminal domain-containing protein [Verrucomicrobia bacterium]|nr:neutral/alkaline non-lysosomal ceramidase N-terminal domain-containing protein [Verrucomicrobiota bacterium]
MNPPLPSRLTARLCWVAFLVVCSAAFPAETKGPAAGWRAGTGREKITPAGALWMTGYASREHPADGTAQELWVKALAVSDPAGNRGVLLTLDLCGVTREISDHVAAELSRRFGLPRSAVMSNVSHTHCSPWFPGSIIGLRILPPDGLKLATEYTVTLEQKMIAAAAAALDSLAPATLAWGEDNASFGVNRRENSEKDVAARRATGTLRGPADPRVPVLAIHDAATGALRGQLMSYACHNTTLNIYQWHGDYAGAAQTELERRHPGATVLFTIGCGADINPNPRGTVALAEQHGRALADAVDRALDRPLTRIEGNFSSALEDIELTFAKKPTEAELCENWEKDQPNKAMYQAWSAAVTDQLKTKGDAILRYSYPVQAWKLGNLSWAALGGEVVVDYGLRLRSEHKGNLWVFGYSTDVMAYIPNERVLKEGRYEGATSMVPYGRPGPWSPGLEDKIVGKTHELLARTGGK